MAFKPMYRSNKDLFSLICANFGGRVDRPISKHLLLKVFKLKSSAHASLPSKYVIRIGAQIVQFDWKLILNRLFHLPNPQIRWTLWTSYKSRVGRA